MSACIILVRHQSRFITEYMGKLRFTLTNVIFWIVLILSCLLSENFAAFNTDPMKGFSVDSAFILTISIIALLVLYYFLEHKKNGLKFDKILLPSLCISGLLLILTIIRQTTRTFQNYDGTGTFTVTFSDQDRVMAALQVVIWLSVIYALVFVYNRFRLNKESYRWIAKIYLLGIFGLIIIDHFTESQALIGILNGTYYGGGLAFYMGNANVWSLLIFSAILSAILLSYKRFRWYYYAAMIYLFFFNVLTTCATTIYITFVAIVAYSLYDIFSRYKAGKKQSLKYLAIFVGSCLLVGGLFTLLVAVKVPCFYNIWRYVSGDIFNKDVTTLTGRTSMWQRIWDLLKGNPLDLIFGLGHQTGTHIYREYMSYTVKSTHNAFLEMFLRYGLVGLTVYIGIVGLTVYCFIRHLLKKNYRFFFIYGLCFASIMIHSLTESTTLFTPNVGGLYFSFVFVLPVINILQEKHFKALKEDLLNTDVSKETIKPSTYLVAIISIGVSIIITKIIANAFNLDLFRSILVLLAILIVGAIILSLLRKNKEYKPIDIINNNILFAYKRLVSKEKDDE